MKHDKIEEVLGYQGLYGEVVEADTYRLRQLDFVPDLILDLGANVGVFARHARDVFPETEIVCVEPDDDNFDNLRRFAPPGVKLVHAAVGKGVMYGKSRDDGSKCVYLSSGLGYPPDSLAMSTDMTRSGVMTILPSELLWSVTPSMTFMVKMDIEGNEHVVLTDPTEMSYLKRADYLAFEIHRYAAHGGLIAEVYETIGKALAEFEETHDCRWEHVHFYARKKACPTGSTTASPAATS